MCVTEGDSSFITSDKADVVQPRVETNEGDSSWFSSSDFIEWNPSRVIPRIPSRYVNTQLPWPLLQAGLPREVPAGKCYVWGWKAGGAIQLEMDLSPDSAQMYGWADLLCVDQPRPDITRNKGVRPKLIARVGERVTNRA
jgi:hypothetical protein